MEESELIDNYLQGRLSKDELELIKAKLATDDVFKRKVILRRAVIAGINEAYADELKEKLRAHDRSLEAKKFTVQFSWKMVAVFAGLLVIALTVLVGKYYFKTKSFEKYDIAEIGIPNPMGEHDDLPLSNAMNQFKSGDYRIALQSFNDLLYVKPNNDTLFYYAGVSAYRSGEVKESIEYFKKIAQGSEYYTRANYRIGLSLWKNEQIDLAIPSFIKATQDSTNEYGIKAKMILTTEF